MPHSNPCQYSAKLIAKLQSLETANQLDFTLINKAIYWAKKYHAGQMRQSGEPFYTHPLQVAYMIADYNLKNDVIVASILHDIVEDTEVTAGMILDAFGRRIEEMVDRLTRVRPDGTKLSVEELLNNAYQKGDIDVLLIKLIDRMHNAMTIRAKSFEKIKKVIKETVTVFFPLVAYLQMPDIEKKLIKLCYEILNINVSSLQDSIISSNNFQLPPLSFCNDLIQMYKQHTLEL